MDGRGFMFINRTEDIILHMYSSLESGRNQMPKLMPLSRCASMVVQLGNTDDGLGSPCQDLAKIL
jgi:hypothetical protein